MNDQAGPRDRIVKAAAALFLKRSYAVVGIAEICAAADVRKGTLYHFFSSKAQVGKAVLDWHAAAFDRQFELAERDSGQIAALVGAVTRVQSGIEDRFGRIMGCPMGNLAAELATTEDELRVHLAGIFASWEQRLAVACRRASEAGELRVGVDPERMARALLAQIEGAILLAKAENRTAAQIANEVDELLRLYLVAEVTA
ncbi:TetR family transcriptional regulator C-terminal domain-containing protein [Streptomyces sp. NPDC048419]|uniref:TetR/AcrR family transcriptional regulator n=1 Tax=Streptomyces sp. NPDC048419 TaxID=3365547 RepID=UPI00371FB676